MNPIYNFIKSTEIKTSVAPISIQENDRSSIAKTRFINKELEPHLSKAKNLKLLFNQTTIAAGILGAVAVSIKVVATMFTISAAALAAATPIGWAAVGLIGLGVLLLAVRHHIISSLDAITETKETLWNGLTQGIKAFGVTLFAIPILACVLLTALAKKNNKESSVFGVFFKDPILAPIQLRSNALLHSNNDDEKKVPKTTYLNPKEAPPYYQSNE